MQNDVYVIGIDSGTQSLRTGIFDLRGNPVVYATQEYPIYHDQIGWAEQSADDWWQATRNTVRKCLEKSNIDPGNSGIFFH